MSSFPPPHHPCSLKTLHRDLSLAILLTGRGEEEQNTRGDVCPQSLSTHFVSCSLHVYVLCVHTRILLHLALRGLDTLEKTGRCWHSSCHDSCAHCVLFSGCTSFPILCLGYAYCLPPWLEIQLTGLGLAPPFQ